MPTPRNNKAQIMSRLETVISKLMGIQELVPSGDIGMDLQEAVRKVRRVMEKIKVRHL